MKKKKKKIKFKTKNIYLILIIIVVFITILFFDNIRLMMKGYSFNEAAKIKKYDITNKILEKPYSKTIASLIDDNLFDNKYIDEYYKIEYVDNKNLSEDISSLLKNYNGEEINIILKKEQVFIEYIISNDIKDIINYLEYDYFNDEYIERYINYFNGNYKDTIIEVNIGLDKENYVDSKIVNKYDTNIIVNKHNGLGDNFKVKDLTLLDKCSEGENYLSIDAKKAYDELCIASKKDNMNLGVTSSFRSHEDQTKTYNYYLKLYGQNYVNKYVSKPGYSEHETGLALDVKSLNSSVFANSKEFIWMKENSYKYGFILRYPEGKERLTGYKYESWHYRYVGKKIAKYIYDNDLTFEEYAAMFY